MLHIITLGEKRDEETLSLYREFLLTSSRRIIKPLHPR